MSSSSALNCVWTVPNIISLARLVLAIVLFALIEGVVGRQDLAALVLFVFAAATDWVDGWYARKYGAVSRLGRIFDPLVDKVIVCGTFVLLADRTGSAILPWMALVIVVRELVVTAIRAEMERTGLDFSAAWSGKLKMLFQCAAIALELGTRAWPELMLGPVSIHQVTVGVVWLAVISTIWSGLEYILAARPLLSQDS
ncbi:MAG: CDP-diacylglycerol--glycerol-3-phosphate 3-phosphatidyltransferase [Pirellulales bacterium]|nr:CDP-diacylglycerol--glycerol-3-phosphate 3-phosphatidyltransferase [Pirellulales bacterium]